MSDIVERAEVALEFYLSGRSDEYRYKSALIRDLVAALNAARAENVRLHYELAQAHTQRDLARNQRDDARARSTGMSP